MGPNSVNQQWWLLWLKMHLTRWPVWSSIHPHKRPSTASWKGIQPQFNQFTNVPPLPLFLMSRFDKWDQLNSSINSSDYSDWKCIQLVDPCDLQFMNGLSTATWKRIQTQFNIDLLVSCSFVGQVLMHGNETLFLSVVVAVQFYNKCSFG